MSSAEETDRADLSKHVNYIPPNEDFIEDLDRGLLAKQQAEKEAEHTPFSLLGTIIFFTTIAILGLIGWGLILSWQSQDLSHIEGFNNPTNAPDIPSLIKKSIQQERSITLTEEDINKYLSAHLSAVQHGPMTIIATSPKVGIKLHAGEDSEDGKIPNGYAEVVIARNLGTEGLQTVSAYISPTQTMGDSHLDIRTKCDFHNDQTIFAAVAIGGKIGQLPVPQGYIYFLTPALENLAEATKEILDLIIDNGLHIHIGEGRLELTPPQKHNSL